MTLTERFEIIPARSWLRDDGKTASIYGSIPWVNDAEKPRWKIETTGWTIKDHKTGTVGTGERPFATRDLAHARLDRMLALYA